MKNKKTQLSVINFSEYNIPTIKESYGKDWVEYGDDNLYPQYLIELYNGSSIHSAIVKGVSAMIYGEGLDATDKDESDEKRESWLKLQSLLHKSPDALKRLSFDLKLHGQCYVNVIWNKLRTKIAEIKHIPAQYVRVGRCDHNGEIHNYYVSSDWSQPRRKEFKPVTVKAFDGKDRSQASQILCIKDYAPNSIFYSTPDYQGSTSYIQLDLEIAQFHLSNIKSGLFPSAMLNFTNGIPTAEERKIVERKIYSKFGGSGNAGKLLITFNDGAETKPEIIPIQTNNADEQYQFLSQETTKKILTGHRVTSPLLFGVKGDGSGFGNNAEELRDSYSLFSSSVIAPFQNTILNGLQHIFKINDINLDLYFKTLKPADFLDLDVVDVQSDEEKQREGLEMAKNEELKDLQDIDTKPTKGMVEEAKKGLEWRREYGRGGTQVGVARARDIANGKNMSLDTIKRMHSFFSRHEKNTKAEGFSPGEDGFPSASRISWALWGGFAGQTWARKKVQEIENVKKLSKAIIVEDDKVDLSYFDDIGITIDNEEWFMAHQEVIPDHKIDKRYHELAYAPAGKPNLISQAGDIGMFRLLYKYSENLSHNSREFCQKMVAKAQNGVMYRIEDLELASQRAVNKGFGPRGSNTYDIALWKGGVNCKHKWIRVFYFRRQVPEGATFVDDDGTEYQAGDFLPNGTLNNFKKVSQQFANGKMDMPDDRIMRTPTYNLPRKGRL